VVSGLLGFEISTDEPLMDAGLDSIGAVELRNTVREKYGVDVPATVTFDYPSVSALAQYLAAKVAPQQALVLHPSAQAGPDMQQRVRLYLTPHCSILI
jgi:acyl carrier protein